MPTAPHTTTSLAFNTALAAYHAATSLRALCRGDDECFEHAEAGTMEIFELVVRNPAHELSAIVSKMGVIMAEFGQGEVPAYLVEGVMMDLIALERAQ